MIAPLVRKAHRGASSRLGSRRHLIRMSAQPATAGSGAPLSSTPQPLTASLTAWTVRGRTSASDNTRGERFSHLLALAPGAACAPLDGVTLHSIPRRVSASGEAGNCSPPKGAHKVRAERPLARSMARRLFTSSDVFFRPLILQSTAHPQASRHPRRVPRLDPRASPAACRLTRTGG